MYEGQEIVSDKALTQPRGIKSGTNPFARVLGGVFNVWYLEQGTRPETDGWKSNEKNGVTKQLAYLDEMFMALISMQIRGLFMDGIDSIRSVSLREEKTRRN